MLNIFTIYTISNNVNYMKTILYNVIRIQENIIDYIIT